MSFYLGCYSNLGTVGKKRSIWPSFITLLFDRKDIFASLTRCGFFMCVSVQKCNCLWKNSKNGIFLFSLMFTMKRTFSSGLRMNKIMVKSVFKKILYTVLMRNISNFSKVADLWSFFVSVKWVKKICKSTILSI